MPSFISIMRKVQNTTPNQKQGTPCKVGTFKTDLGSWWWDVKHRAPHVKGS